MDNELEFKGADKVRAIQWFAMYADGFEVDKRYKLTVKEVKRKRSLDANAYFWTIADKLAAHLHKDKTEIYRSYIKEIGGVSDIVCVVNNAVDKLCEAWEHNGIGWQTDRVESKIDGCTNVILYYGSSTYNSEQMSRLIDLAVQDCKQYDIPTYDPEEIERLVKEWGCVD
jgi:hypothetical protein